jgi:hypothetical protein
MCGSDLHLFSGHTGALSGARDFFRRIQGREILGPGMRVAVVPQTHPRGQWPQIQITVSGGGAET